MTNADFRNAKLLKFQNKIDLPMLLLSFIWLCVLITELVNGTNDVLYEIGNAIWIMFILYFSLRFATAKDRWIFIRTNWLFVLALIASVLRFFPFFQNITFARIVTATFGMQVIWIFTSADQGMRALRRKLGRRGAGYAFAFTLMMIFVGAAGVLYFERASDDPLSIQTYPRALWWAAMQMTNIGSAYAFKTTGGRAICLAMSIYAAAMFGYLTAIIATFFIDRAAKDPKSEIPSQKSIQSVHNEIAQLRLLIEETLKHLSKEKQ